MRILYSLNGTDWKILGLPPQEWVWRRLGEADTDLDNLRPAAPAWLPATVPGDVISDLRDAGEIPDPSFGRNSRACEWVSQRDWVYRKEFVAPAAMRGKRRVRLRFGGVDFSCHVFLNGVPLGDHVGMNDSFVFDVTAALRWDAPNRLIVAIDQAPAEPAVQGQIGYTRQIRLWKARFAYGWDWCTRLVPLGIWQDVTLEADDGVVIESVWVRPELRAEADGSHSAQITFRSRLSALPDRPEPVAVDLRLFSPDGEEIPSTALSVDSEMLLPSSEETGEARTLCRLQAPRLWYPNGYGDQPLYTAQMTLRAANGATLDEQTVRFGIRSLRLVSNKSASQDALPYTLEVNGVCIFMTGWNWVPIDQLYGRPHPEKYRHWLQLAKEAHCNLLRVWGGGYLERKQFYDLCDEAGILVWQEFLQSSSGIDNEPATDPEYLAYCREQAEAMIVQRRNHPSLALWCGGNELMTPDWKPLTNRHPAIAVLKETVERLDPGRPFLPTSPSGPVFGASLEHSGQMHDVHGNWTYLGDPEHYRFFNGIDPLLHSEFGVEGAANLEALRRFLPPESLWPPDRTNPDWVHHGSWWLNREAVERLFGPLETIEAYVKASQWVQAEGLRYAVEANRRREGHTSGVIPWQFNEAWPNVSCTNVVDYYGQPKPAYWTVRSAYAPVHVSAQYDKLQWEPGEEFAAEVWLHWLAQTGLCEGRLVSVRWRLFDLWTGETLRTDDGRVAVSQLAGSALARAVSHVVPEDRSLLALSLRCVRQSRGAREETLAENTYLFSTMEGPPFAALLKMPPTRLRYRRLPAADPRRERILEVRNDGEVPALYVTLTLPDAPLGVLLDRNYILLRPGERVRFRLSGDLPDSLNVTLSAWNVEARQLRL